MEKRNVKTTLDGDQYCAQYEGLENFPEDPVGWGSTEEEAVSDLIFKFPLDGEY